MRPDSRPPNCHPLTVTMIAMSISLLGTLLKFQISVSSLSTCRSIYNVHIACANRLFGKLGYVPLCGSSAHRPKSSDISPESLAVICKRPPFARRLPERLSVAVPQNTTGWWKALMILRSSGQSTSFASHCSTQSRVGVPLPPSRPLGLLLFPSIHALRLSAH